MCENDCSVHLMKMPVTDSTAAVALHNHYHDDMPGRCHFYNGMMDSKEILISIVIESKQAVVWPLFERCHCRGDCFLATVM